MAGSGPSPVSHAMNSWSQTVQETCLEFDPPAPAKWMSKLRPQQASPSPFWCFPASPRSESGRSIIMRPPPPLGYHQNINRFYRSQFSTTPLATPLRTIYKQW